MQGIIYIEIIEKQLHCVDTEKSSTFPFNLNANLTHNSKVSDTFMYLMYILPQNQSCFIHFNLFKFTVIFIKSSIEGARFYLPSSLVWSLMRWRGDGPRPRLQSTSNWVRHGATSTSTSAPPPPATNITLVQELPKIQNHVYMKNMTLSTPVNNVFPVFSDFRVTFIANST